VIIDTSAMAAIIFREPDAAALATALAAAPIRRMSAASFVELCVVVDGRRDPVLSGAVEAALARSGIIVVPLTPQQARIARDAYQRFGRGSGHPARLTMGDCFAYALARDLGEPLLFKGNDFALTDIEIVVEPVKRHRLSEVIASYRRAAEA
jgi:ribonuclease VapC